MSYRFVKERPYLNFVVTPDGPCLFRFESGTTGDVDDWTIDMEPELILYAYPIIKFTPKGYWIQGKYIKRFVLAKDANARARFAYSDIIYALESFIIRKQIQISHLNRTLEEVEGALKIAKGLTCTQ